MFKIWIPEIFINSRVCAEELRRISDDLLDGKREGVYGEGEPPSWYSDEFEYEENNQE